MIPRRPLEICRVCRCGATPEQPLFHPCKCSGSIRHVHQDWYVCSSGSCVCMGVFVILIVVTTLMQLDGMAFTQQEKVRR